MSAVVVALSLGGLSLAQTHRVAKPEKVTRAIGVYEWTGDMAKPTASRLVPVSLFIDGHLVDAGVYLARPVPFAITPGYVYSVEQAGEPLGVLDLDQAQNIVTRRAQDDDNPLGAWYAYGHYTPPAPAKKQPVLQTSAHPGVIVSTSADGRPRLNTTSADTPVPPKPADPKAAGDDSDRPHMNRRPDASSTPTKPATDNDTTSTTTTTSASQDDPDRPHMSRRNDTSPSAGNDPSPTTTTASAGPAPPAAADDDPERPTLRRRETKSDGKRKKESGSGVTGMATSLNDDPDRPTLTHGSASAPTGTPPLLGMPPDLRQAVAVSDATLIDSHPFARAWESPGEKASTLAAFQSLARPRVANYLTQNLLQPGTALVPGKTTAQTKASPTPAPETVAPPRLQRGRPGSPVTAGDTPPSPSTPPAAVAKPTAARTGTTKAGARSAVVRPASPNPLLLQDEQISGFTLSYGGLPTFVYTALTPVSNGLPVRITLVAQQLPSGELQVALSSVTDEAHLDRTPWMRLVDVVDPTDSHRASFLFELRAKASRQFALYSLVSARAEQSFVTRLFE